MAATAAAIAYSTILKKGDGGTPETFTDYGLEVTTIDGLGFSRSAIDATHLQSDNGYSEFIHGIKTAKPFTAECNLVPSTVDNIQTLLEGAKGNWQILFPDNSYVTFAAGITDCTIGGMTPDGKMTMTIGFTPSGKPTWG